MRAGETEVGMSSPALFSLYVNNIPTAMHRDNLAVCVNYMYVLATSHKPFLLVHYLTGFDTLGKRLEDGCQNFVEHYAALWCEGATLLKA